MRLLRWLFGAKGDAGGRGLTPPTRTEPALRGPTRINILPGETVTLPDGAVLRMPTHDELETRRLTKLRNWQAQVARLGGIVPKPVTRGNLAAVLRARGWNRIIKDGEGVFLRNDDRGEARIFAKLKTLNGGPTHAPYQELSLFCSLSPPDYLAAVTAIAAPHPALPLVSRITVERQGFILTRADLDSAVTEAEAKLAAADITMYLDQAAGWDPSRPGSAGLVHLAALVLRGDRARLDHYAALGVNAGFVPYITPEMIARAAALARAH